MEYSDYNLSLSLDIATHGSIDSRWCIKCPPEPYNRIYLPQDGDAAVTIAGHRYIIEPGYTYLIPAGSPMQTYCREKCELYWIHFYMKSFFSHNFFDLFPYRIQRKSTASDATNMENLISLKDSQAMHDILLRGAILQELTASFLQPDCPGRDLSKFATVLRQIDMNYAKNIKVSTLAKSCGMSPPYFSGIFKKTFGIPPQKYIIRVRLNAAIPMLLGGCTLDEIALKLSFHDAFHFSKTFKLAFGCSPRRWKQINKSKTMP